MSGRQARRGVRGRQARRGVRGLAGWRAAAVALVAVVTVAACSAGGPAHPGPGQSGTPAGGPTSTTYPQGPPAGPAGPAPTTVAGYYAQRLRWRPCDHGFRCARMWVPFDYQRPGWRRFSLPLIKLPATGPGRRIGSLVVNPGGPGGSGISYALQARSVVAAAVRARFDVVGFDPRGVGGSQPAVRCLPAPQLDRYFATDDTPATPAQVATVVSQSKLFAQGCEHSSGALLPYVGTANAARDLDVLRAVLGDAKLTYLGKSYGTYLGTWYAHLFPHRIRALVLDGAVDPAQSALAMNVAQARGFEVALRSFTANCLAHAGCPLAPGGAAGAGAAHGSGPAAVSAAIGRLQGLLDRAGRSPLASQVSGQPGDAALLLNGVAAALYSQSYWQYLRQGLADAFAGDGTLLVELGDLLVERNQRGQYSNLAAANMAVNCLDRPVPHALASWESAAAAAARAAPQFGAAIMWGSLPCAYWPVPAAAPVSLAAPGAPPILVVGNTRDPATPFPWAQALARDLRSSVLLGWRGNGHTAYMMGSSCIDSAVDRYLIDLVPPRNGTMCP